MSVPQANSTQTIDRPIPEEERTRVTPVAPLSWYSSGRVTSPSTSSGASPGASVSTVTVGRFRSGNTSTGVRASWYSPATHTARAVTRTSGRFFREKARTYVSMGALPQAQGLQPLGNFTPQGLQPLGLGGSPHDREGGLHL